ncbi:MAG: calcium/sodium antiporter [Actinomycetota bacterium]
MQFLTEPTLPVALIEIALGVVLLAYAADFFVDGAARVASKANVSPVLIGAVVVGFGTSAPELLVSGIAAAGGNPTLGVGNVVGSNVANLSLVLGSAALIVPVLVTRPVLKREAPLSLASVILFAILTFFGGLSTVDGVILGVALLGALGWVIIGGRSADGDGEVIDTALSTEIGRTAIGLVGTVIGAQLLVYGAEAVAERFGLSGGFIGFTLLAVGTSLPELVAGIAAARRGATELLLGNLLGSNLFNSLAVGSVIGLVSSGSMSDDGLRMVGLPVMVVVATGAWIAMTTLKRVDRHEGMLLLAAWLVAVILLARFSEDAEVVQGVLRGF